MKTHAINLTLFKIVGFYQIIDQNSRKVYGFNIFQLFNALFTAISATITALGLSGMFYRVNGSNDYDIKVYLKMISSVVFVMIGYFKMYIVISNASSIRNLFDVAHKSFSTSKHCKQFYFKMEICGKNFTTFFLWYYLLFIMVAFSYTSMPVFLNNNERKHGKTQNYNNSAQINVLNYMYPITTETYNTSYMTIYIVESIVCSYAVFVLGTVDLFIFALLKIISTQYEIIVSAYGTIKFKDEEEYGKLMFEKICELCILLVYSDF